MTRRKPPIATLLVAALAASPFIAANAADAALVKPGTLIVDHSLPKAVASANQLAAQRYDTFWNTGDESLAKAALSPEFIDRTPPPGRAQGPEGPLQASRTFRQAVPDLTCDVQQMLVVGDRVVSHLHFAGHFTGSFNGVQGKGQAIDFIATDIYRVTDGKIVENWHLEDNLTLLKQLGAIKN
ncbi:ester cyclase [Dyella sp. C11]|uniref:ester cyclase n=1 Tax=Dyella sp. C11 TaxID=2126991 RepID=UPI000D64552B|nr:ester cyclase [Dyella sp. C11]